jgi:hypothetical protein
MATLPSMTFFNFNSKRGLTFSQGTKEQEIIQQEKYTVCSIAYCSIADTVYRFGTI